MSNSNAIYQTVVEVAQTGRHHQRQITYYTVRLSCGCTIDEHVFDGAARPVKGGERFGFGLHDAAD